MPFPDNSLYLIDDKKSSNKEIARLDGNSSDSISITSGSKMVKQYVEIAPYGWVYCFIWKGAYNPLSLLPKQK